MEAVRKQALLTFKNGQVTQENLGQLKKLMDNITSSELKLNSALLGKPVMGVKPSAPVTYLDIDTQKDYVLSMFVLRPGSKLPLHDHPMMHGLCKVVHGTVLIKNYSLTDDPLAAMKDCEVIVKREADKIVSEKDETVQLSPTTGNIHEILAVDGGAAFIDFLTPPYYSEIRGTSYRRACHYYVPVIDQRNGSGGDGENAMVKLKRTRGPPEYWTDEDKYQGP